MFDGIWSWLGEAVPALRTLSGLPLVMLFVVAALTLAFFIGYAWKGGQVGWQLRNAVRQLDQLSRSKKSVDPGQVARVLVATPFRHLWQEYAQTLHEQMVAAPADARSENADDDVPAPALVTRMRATMPAEAFFTRDALVDSRLFDDFTRHLPGVLTGLGIIGTFAGLLNGLASFDASTTASAVAGLKPLLDGVAHAFSASALAIACAMIVTFVSRFCLAMFYRQVDRLNQTIDSLYSAGAGEEYLSRLVESSEKAEQHAAELKQSLVGELSRMMNELVDRQIEAQLEGNRTLGTQIGAEIGARFGDTMQANIGMPLQQLAESLLDQQQHGQETLGQTIADSLAQSLNQSLSQSISDALGDSLRGVLAQSFDRIDDSVAAPIRELQQQLSGTLAEISASQQSLQHMIGAMSASNGQMADQLGGNLESVLRASADSQTLLIEQIRQLVGEIGQNVTADHEAGRKVMEQSVGAVMQRLSDGMDRLEANRRDSAARDDQRHEQLANRADEMVGSLAARTDGLLKAVGEQVLLTQRNIDVLGAVSTKAISGMNAGAGSMAEAARRFESAGSQAAIALEKSAAATDKITLISQSLDAAAKAVHQGFIQYDATRRTVDSQVTALTELIGNVRAEAGMSKRMLSDLERIVAQLKLAEQHSQQYLEGVNRTLVRSFEEFGGALTTQLKSTIGDTDRHLTSGVQQLNGVIQHIGLTLSRMKAN